MTRRAWTLLGASAVLLSAGVWLRWPELTGLGAAALVLVTLARLVWSVGGPVSLLSSYHHLTARRGAPLSLELSVSGLSGPLRWRGVRLVEGPVDFPRGTHPLPRASRGRLSVPVDTSCRGLHAVGPFSVVLGDPWGLIRRVLAETDEIALLVRPQTADLSRALGPDRRAACGGASSRQPGHEHFWALRDYVFGDEPRKVHWRSSARVGRLVVRQEVGATAPGTLVVLDTDASAYGSEVSFGSAWLPDRFERAVELVAALVEQEAERRVPVWMITTARSGEVVAAPGGRLDLILDALALVRVSPPVDNAPAQALWAARRLPAGRIAVVTGSHSSSLTAALQGRGHLLVPDVWQVPVDPALPVRRRVAARAA